MLKIRKIIIYIITLFIIACSNDSSTNNSDIEVSISEAKCDSNQSITNEYGYTLDSNQTYILYKYDKEKKHLYIGHYNILLNCNREKIGADVKIADKNITIKEYQYLLEDDNLECSCLFDIDYELNNIEPAEYNITIYPPFGEKIDLRVNLEENIEELKSFEQNSYPYGEEINPISNEPQIREIINDKFYNIEAFSNNQTETITSKDELDELISKLREIGDKSSNIWADRLENEKELIDFDKSYIVTYTFSKGCLYKYNTTIRTSINSEEDNILSIILTRENDICATVMTQYFLVYQVPNSYSSVQFIVDDSTPITIYR